MQWLNPHLLHLLHGQADSSPLCRLQSPPPSVHAPDPLAPSLEPSFLLWTFSRFHKVPVLFSERAILIPRESFEISWQRLVYHFNWGNSSINEGTGPRLTRLQSHAEKFPGILRDSKHEGKNILKIKWIQELSYFYKNIKYFVHFNIQWIFQDAII